MVLEWLRHVISRTLAAFLPFFARPDDGRAKRVLSNSEYQLYMQLDARDRAHAAAVYARLLELHPDASEALRRATLLHDAGKLGQPFNPWFRIAAGLYTPRSVPLEPRFTGLRGAWQIKRHHPHYGAALIRQAGGGERVAELVARHHEPRGDPEAALLKAVDGRF